MNEAPHLLRLERLTKAGFAPFGEVIEPGNASRIAMNSGAFERFNDLATIDVAPGRTRIGLARAVQGACLPHTFDLVERHPLGSQAFVPLEKIPFVVVVAPAGESVRAENLRAFMTDGTQGVNYFSGTWHMPLIALEAGQSFLIIDRGDEGPDANQNCDEVHLDRPVTLVRD